MKAWVLEGFGLDNLKMVDVPMREVGPHDVVVSVKAVSLNYRDKLLVDGLYNPDLRFPITQVADTAGEVVDAGAEVSRFRRGDRVITNYATRWIDGPTRVDDVVHTLGNTIPGGLAEYLVINEEVLVHAPEYLTHEEASTLPVAALTAWHALTVKRQLAPGETVLVQGTGGVSIFGLQLASALGAKVIATSSSDDKLQRARRLGAHQTINYVRTPEWHTEALRLTSQQGVDNILEVAAGKTLRQSLEAIKPGGQISVIGVLDGFVSEIPIFTLLQKQASIVGMVTGSRRMFEEMNAALANFQIHPVIDAVYWFEDARQAYDHLYRGAFGKIVIKLR
ncbi:zinc-dependent alcohol dehydrogenase family protein [Occallatibacter riparius]|uniref:NAD(P)-dependent alcohol dehydrogenase n=1 Tax=Occallatibacter riparius TaxID=1002689 RepID=A0A9J7BFD1_9BACT|nr:NAD(P)-dependent alcohol dehydrogenase [Occallatibacter riparius]UWZ81716.1 NAD(P)-dependent alcohol dehydrogenase [Occallatibacter riparius]